MQTAGTYWEYIQTILIFGLLSLLLQWIAKTRGFYTLTPPVPGKEVLPGTTVLVMFVIYLASTLGVAPLLIRLIQMFYGLEKGVPPPTLMSWVQLGVFTIIFLLFYLYCRTQNRNMMTRIWKDRSLPNAKPIVYDFGLGVVTWFLSFPLVVVVGQLADMLLLFFFGFESYEQVAVRYLKMTLASPQMLAVALFMILIAAPFAEEFLFRGMLQTYLKRLMHPKAAIFLSSLAFALFHIASSQGIGNISLAASLFTFALFLGFIYERQGSLFASIGLHMTFNTMSALRILFFPES